MATLHLVIDTFSDRHLASDPVTKYKKRLRSQETIRKQKVKKDRPLCNRNPANVKHFGQMANHSTSHSALSCVVILLKKMLDTNQVRRIKKKKSMVHIFQMPVRG